MMAGRHFSHRTAFFAIFLLAVMVRIPMLPSPEEPVYGEAVWVARSLAETGDFANPFNTPTGPTAHVAPVYAGLLSLILKVFPYGPSFHLAIMLLALGCSALTWAILPWVAARLALPASVGMAAGVLGALYPFRKTPEMDGSWEAPLVAFLLALMVPQVWSADWENRRKLVALGLGMGLLILAYPVAVLAWIGLLVVLNRRGRVSARQAVLALCVSLALLTPWLARNYFALGGFSFVRSNLGLELWISNGGWSKPTVHENLQYGIREKTVPHPNVSRVEAARMREMGELAYHRMRLNDAMARIGTHSREFALMTAKRIGYFLAPQRRNWVLRGVEVMLACMALAGLVLMLRRRVPAGAAILVIWLTTPPIYFFLQSDERYRYPIEWTIFLCLGYALTALAEGVLPGRVRQSGAPGEPLEFVEEQTR